MQKYWRAVRLIHTDYAAIIIIFFTAYCESCSWAKILNCPSDILPPPASECKSF